MSLLYTGSLFVITALAEILGCYLPWLWLRENGSPWLLVPGALCLAAFAWLLSLHPTAYGGVYVSMAILWLWWVDGVKPLSTDLI